ncbi:MAG: hypothetical protein NTY31_02565 [Candidatus Falkowbacteria bacterium]|nr:hypothetical protein [Candidatus Falkowbacteria bacterium]
MKKLRKFFTVSVMVLSIIAMSGLVAPSATNAAASTGDLIKMAGNTSVYYLAADGKRYVFPHFSVYFSWYSDFSGVVTIPASELQSYPLGGNVTMRPGTKLVKITTDPKVYAVEPNGVLRAIQSEAQASALYGTNWNKKILDVSDAFFTNYTLGSVLPSGQYSIGDLVKNNGASEIFYYDGTSYRKIATEAAFYANRFNFDNVLTASTAVAGTGVTITGAESALVNVAQNGSAVVITGSGLMVSLSASTPLAASVPQNGARVPMAKVNLTAANDGAVSVNSITVNRIGLSTYNNIDKVWAEKDGVIVASKKSMNSNDQSILTFSPALVVNAGQTVSVDLLVSLKLDNGVAAGNIGLSIPSLSAVSATSASVSGSFPINGNLMSATSYNVVNLAISEPTTATTTVKVGDEKVELGRFTLGFSGTAKDVSLKSIMLKNNGVEDLSTATMNLYLEQAGNKVSVNTVVSGRFVTFYFATAGLDLLKDDSSKIFYIKGDVIAKENVAPNSFMFFLNKSTDLVAYEKATSFGANVYADNTTVAADAYHISNVTITAGAVAVTKKSTSPSDTTIIKGSDSVMLLANIRADEAITADGLNIKYTSGSLASTTNQFENVRVYLNGLLLDSFDPVASTTLDYIVKTIDSTLNLVKGDNEVKIMAKAKTTAPSGSAIRFRLDGGIFNSQNPEYVVSGNSVSGSISGTASGATFTVSAAVLTTVRSDGYSAGKTIVAGSSDVSLGKFTLKATNDVIRVTSIALGTNASTTPENSGNISDMKLYVDGVQVGSTVDFGSTGATFSSLNFDIAKDSTKAVELKGSFDSSALGGFETLMTVNSQDSRGTSITAGNKATTTTFALAPAGTLNVELGGNTPAAAILVSKAAEQEIAQFKFTAISDSADLTEINVVNWDGSAITSSADARIASIKLYDGTTLIDSFVPVSGTGKFTITNGKVLIAANTSKTLSVKVSLNNIDNDASATNKDIMIRFTTVKAKSSAGSEAPTTANANGNSFRIRKTVPTVALLTLPGSLLTAGENVVSKFTVTADINGDVTLRKIVLKYATSTNVDLATMTGNAVRVNGVVKNASSTVDLAAKTITVDFANSSYEVITANSSKTFEILSDISIGGTGTSTESLTTKIQESAAYGETGDFEWSDGSSMTTFVGTWSNGHRVPGLPTTTQVMSK